MRDHLTSAGVLPTHFLVADDLSTLAVVHLADGQATYTFHAEGAADRGLLPAHLEQLPDGGALPAGAALHVGSIALVLEPVASTLEGLLRQQARRRLLSLDPNVRPGLIPDREAYVRRLEGWMTLVDVVKASEEDIAWLYPHAAEADVVARWLAAGVALVIVTAGADGARATTSSAAAAVPAPTVRVADTVGAGDAFTAGALAHLHARGALHRDAIQAFDTARLEPLLEYACLVAADTCTRPGGDPPRRAQLPDPLPAGEAQAAP